MIRAVIFDIDNTLYNYTEAHQSAFAALCAYTEKEFGIPADSFRRIHDEMQKELNRRLGDTAATHNRLIRYQNILEKLKIPLAPHALILYDTYWNELLSNMRVSDGVYDAFQYLKENHIPIGVGTDMTAHMQFLKLDNLRLLPAIDFIVSSEEAGCEKPSADFFQLCVQKAGVSPSSCLFVGDNYKKDVLGAAASGMHGVWYRPQGTDLTADVPQISHFSQLQQMIELYHDH